MLQDLDFGKLDNQYRNEQATAADRILLFREGQILIGRDAEDTLSLPTLAQTEPPKEAPRYLFTLQGQRYFLWTDEAPSRPIEGFDYEGVRTLRQLKCKEICFAVLTGWHLYHWYRANRFCGCCGAETEHDGKERMLRCPACGNMIFPRISPAVIVAVTNGDQILLSKYAGRAFTRYALLAGYTEIGETIEETVHREVYEEVGLKVQNLRYYKKIGRAHV